MKGRRRKRGKGDIGESKDTYKEGERNKEKAGEEKIK